MNVEQNRLETFTNWPADASVSPQRIAKAGFFFTKRGLEVECFSCGVKIDNWNYGDQVMARHKTLSPQCPFVLNPTNSGNVTSVAAPPSGPSSSYVDYKIEALRLASFENWPIPDIVSPADLARAGFYSLKNGDNTKCAFCKGVVRAWEPNDIPDIEHRRHFPTCPFVITTINPRLANDDVNSSRLNTLEQEATLKNVTIVNTVDGNLDSLGVQKHIGPRRPDYGTVESRIRSYKYWSPFLIQTPDVLAQAGFFYEGTGDQVRCFHCDGGLRHWDPDDDPWTEHARWFPACSFVNLVKGQDFVNACSLERVANPQTEKVQPRSRRHVSDEELRQQMISDVALAALGIGIDVQRVRRAIKEKLETTGRGYSQADALVEAALNVQLEEDDNFDMTSSNNRIRNNITTILNTAVKPPAANRDPDANGDDSSGPNDNKSLLIPTVTKQETRGTESGKLEKTLSLEEENRLLKEARLCKICMDAEVGIVFLPCGHFATCVNCAPNLEHCPVCRCAIKATVRTFLS